MGDLKIMSTTQVDTKDLPQVETVYNNAPEDLPGAIARIMELEMRLEDLSRASEIAMITRQFDMMESFKVSADESLVGKITIEQPTAENFRLTVVDGEISKATQKKLNKAITKQAKKATGIA
jgi:hypothetical protein